jgi:phospholipase D/transphosphatidylase
MRTRAPEDDGRAVTSHAKFLSVDHRFLLVGSANFSYSAEERNVELGLRLDDPALAASVEKQMRDLEANVYEQVHC